MQLGLFGNIKDDYKNSEFYRHQRIKMSEEVWWRLLSVESTGWARIYSHLMTVSLGKATTLSSEDVDVLSGQHRHRHRHNVVASYLQTIWWNVFNQETDQNNCFVHKHDFSKRINIKILRLTNRDISLLLLRLLLRKRRNLFRNPILSLFCATLKFSFLLPHKILYVTKDLFTDSKLKFA